MKKINFKVLLIVVLSFVLVFAFAACQPDEPTITVTPPPTDDGPDIAAYLAEVIEGVDARIDSLADLTDRFEADIEFYATVNEVEYLVSIKANVDIRDNVAAVNASNKIAIEITKDEDVVLGFYYNGAEDAFFLSIPSENIRRYINGFDLLSTVVDNTDPVVGGFASAIPVDSINLSSMVAGMLDLIAPMAFSDVESTTVGNVTTYDFTFNEALTGMLGTLFGVLGDSAAGIEDVIDQLFGIEGFSLTEFTVPTFELHVLAEVGPSGLSKIGIDLALPAFTFKINNEDAGTPVAAFNLVAGINLLLDPADSTYAVDLTVPTIAASGYEYFSPMNLETSGTFTLAGEGGATFVVKSNINPFAAINPAVLADAEAFIQIKTWLNGQTIAEATDLFVLNLIGGNVYVDIDYNKDGNFDYYTLNIQQGMDLIVDVIGDLDTLVLPSAEETAMPAIDLQAILGLVTAVPAMISEEGVLTIDKAFVEQVITTFAIEDVKLPTDVELTAWLTYDVAEKLNGARGEFYMLEAENFTLIGAEETYAGIKYALSYVEDEDGLYKVIGTTYSLIVPADNYTGIKYSPAYTVSATGTYKAAIEKQICYYAEILVVGDVYTVEVGTKTAIADVKKGDAVFTLTDDGFTFVLTTYKLVEGVVTVDEVKVDLTLVDFELTWGRANDPGAVAPTGEDLLLYKDVLEINHVDVTSAQVIAMIQSVINEMLGTEMEFETNCEASINDVYQIAGTVVVAPTTPTNEGFTFGGWYVNEDLTGDAYVFTTMPAEDITLYAKWIPEVV